MVDYISKCAPKATRLAWSSSTTDWNVPVMTPSTTISTLEAAMAWCRCQARPPLDTFTSFHFNRIKICHQCCFPLRCQVGFGLTAFPLLFDIVHCEKITTFTFPLLASPVSGIPKKMSRSNLLFWNIHSQHPTYHH